ncbi:multisubunit sodium/proton antiporter, MrpD subunit (TC 2.A.63.1) [Geoalkalibacter ferrihydriticus]|uniref:Monovalent cation/H+ antiporter subunit D n=2 Tax=Geoalkalibacter ferrihydriticus TaxID=392333 RepID=A0A0C2HTG0_9BACT|nr:Na(+)/H(+) antiporter subunit D [Geoalkalibacter ferrihydriticus]KIH76112.1 monovalent cation/H+ antiporter subunit D [Geoalkalibacter ferrihydriticus DSM 17813]SDM44897.1 multisubunit sodium/proton antiporter, MrpD subunit (TC 2.A.63.1) [Geoalkalibacter ferrihydriticus]
MTASIFIHPASWFILGALLMPLSRRLGVQKVWLVLIPLIALALIHFLPESFGRVSYLGFELQFGRVDRLTFIFLHVFALMALMGSIFALQVKESGQHIAAFLYVAGSFGVTLAGDYLTLFIFWELMAFASTFLIWYRKKQRSIEAGYRYLLVHVAGGLVLLAGIFLLYQSGHDLSFGMFTQEGAGWAEYLVMIGFILNAAVPPIHAWLPDAYPEATVTGAVFMCAFTTKTAVYVLARGFPGFEVLAILGAVMALYGVAYAVIENDARRILAYHVVSQVGYMVCGVGIGTAMALNGTAAHAYAHIVYKALLFMGAGAVLEMTGRSKLSELGGLYKYMPWTMVFTVIGGLAISGFPLTSGFISKSMIVAAAGENHQIILLIMLTLAGVGTFLSVGIKLPYFIWFGRDSGVQAKEAPWNMQLAMAMAAFVCIFLGMFPGALYSMLPYPVEYQPYTAYHLSETFQIFGFTGLGFYLMVKYLKPHSVYVLDIDWFYRKGSLRFMRFAAGPVVAANEWVSNVYRTIGTRLTMAAARAFTWFDREGIDWTIDGAARGVVDGGDRLRRLQTGRIQQYIGGAVLALLAVLVVVLFI